MSYDPSEHLVRLKRGGDPYLPAGERVVWFRQDHPDWGIETCVEHLDVTTGVAVIRATVREPQGRIMAQAMAHESAAGFPDYIEKSETSAIARALALCGYGTEFCDVDGERPAAAGPPAAPPADGFRCEAPGCGRTLTRGQAEISQRAFGRLLCLACQKASARV